MRRTISLIPENATSTVGKQQKKCGIHLIPIKFVLTVLVGMLFMLVSPEAKAQSSRDSESSSKKKSTSPFYSKKKASNKQYDQGIKDYEKLMKENKKKYAKMQKGMKKPQYSDPSYFGHKKPPKKRSLEKRKFCKECRIIH